MEWYVSWNVQFIALVHLQKIGMECLKLGFKRSNLDLCFYFKNVDEGA